MDTQGVKTEDTMATPPVLFPAEVMEHLAPKDQAHRDDDLTSLLRNDYIYRTVIIAPRSELVIRDVKTRHFLSARRMSQFVGANQTAGHDNITAAKYELAFSIVRYSVAGEDVPLGDLDSADPKTAEAAFKARLDLVDLWPTALWTRALSALQVLMGYVDEISSPESLVDFSTAPQEA